ncbi:MAG: hypothetical protein ACPGRD_03950 [Planktomarina sp.]
MALVTMAFADVAAAQDLQSRVSFQIVETDVDGNETFETRTTVAPGETLEYSIQHMNGTDDDLQSLIVFAPIPAGASFAPDTQATSVKASFEVQAEMDPENEGLEWSSLPATRLVENADGVQSEQPLPASEIKAVRWNLATLESGATAQNTYRVTIN